MIDRRRLRTWIGVASALLLLMAGTGAALAGGGGHWEVAGAWTRDDASAMDGKGALITMAPSGPNTLQVTWKTAQKVLFPGEATRTPYTGNAHKVGPKVWEFALLSYIQSPDGTVLATALIHGDFELLPDGRIHWRSWGAIYPPWEDPFDGLPPSWGCFGPGEGHWKRIEIIASCGPVE